MVDINISYDRIFGETIESVGNMAQSYFFYVIQVDWSFPCRRDLI